jgi:hypothetical protein
MKVNERRGNGAPTDYRVGQANSVAGFAPVRA